MDYLLKQYIECRQEEEIESNQADHRPTRQNQLEGIKESCIIMFNKGEEIVKTISEDEISQCREMYLVDNPKTGIYYADRLSEMTLEGARVLVSTYLQSLSKLRLIKERVLI